jgi:hypothetical protein
MYNMASSRHIQHFSCLGVFFSIDVLDVIHLSETEMN